MLLLATSPVPFGLKILWLRLQGTLFQTFDRKSKSSPKLASRAYLGVKSLAPLGFEALCPMTFALKTKSLAPFALIQPASHSALKVEGWVKWHHGPNAPIRPLDPWAQALAGQPGTSFKQAAYPYQSPSQFKLSFQGPSRSQVAPTAHNSSK